MRKMGSADGYNPFASSVGRGGRCKATGRCTRFGRGGFGGSRVTSERRTGSSNVRSASPSELTAMSPVSSLCLSSLNLCNTSVKAASLCRPYLFVFALRRIRHTEGVSTSSGSMALVPTRVSVLTRSRSCSLSKTYFSYVTPSFQGRLFKRML